MRRYVTSSLAGLALVALSACGAQQAPTSAPTIQAPTSGSQMSLSKPSNFKTQWWYGGYGLGGYGLYGLGGYGLYGLGGYGLYGGLYSYPFYSYGLGYPYYSSYWW